MDEVSFYAGLALLVIGLCGLLFGHRVTADESAIEFAGRSRVPAFVVMSFGVVLMLISTRFPSRISKSHEVREFSQPGGMANFPCESHDTSHVIYRAPTGLKIVDAQADTRDVVSTKRSSVKITSQDDHQVTAQADFDGKDRDLGINCPGGGHGRVVVHGHIESE
jgi:hypothetical protein